jgi:hypothetical protein
MAEKVITQTEVRKNTQKKKKVRRIGTGKQTERLGC